MAQTSATSPLDSLSVLLFKTQPCTSASCPQPGDCWYFHTSADRRRPPIVPGQGRFAYKAELCALGPVCEDEKCEFARNDLESAFHPLHFKARMCEKLPCRRKYCPYAHKTEDLRSTNGPIKRETPLPKVFPRHKTSVSALTIPQLMLFYQEKGSLEQALALTLAQVSIATGRVSCAQCRKSPAEGVKACCGFRQCLACWQAETLTCALCGREERLHVLFQSRTESG